MLYLISNTVVEQLLGKVALLPHVLVDSLYGIGIKILN